MRIFAHVLAWFSLDDGAPNGQVPVALEWRLQNKQVQTGRDERAMAGPDPRGGRQQRQPLRAEVYALRRLAGIALVLGATLGLTAIPTKTAAQSIPSESSVVKNKNLGTARSRAAQTPRSEDDQALVDGWPLYRTERGQTAFNDAMATLKVTEASAPGAAAFRDCAELNCQLQLPAIDAEGWMPAGRIWVSPSEYVLFVQSHRLRGEQGYRRRGFRSMRYFVYHEFHNGTRNTDAFDTISSHSGSVYVPLYLSKQATDAKGRRFVMVVQVAPYDVMSIHASNYGSSGPGMEVAKNVSDALEPLQAQAGILVGTIIKTAAPHLQIVNHRGSEGQPMLSAYQRHLSGLKARAGAAVALPFVPAPPQRVAAAAATRLDELMLRRGQSPRIPVAERGIVRSASLTPAPAADDEPTLIEPIRPAAPPRTRQRLQ